jgi:hypothetical protein
LAGFLWLGGAAAQTCQTASIPPDTPTSRFVFNRDGTVSDAKTGLMWKQCSEGQSGAACGGGGVNSYTWKEALDYVQTFNQAGGFAGHQDWRLPNIQELRSIVERQCFDPAINLAVFPATFSNDCWSSSPYAGNGYLAWDVDFYHGYGVTNVKIAALLVRLVRSGQ